MRAFLIRASDASAASNTGKGGAAAEFPISFYLLKHRYAGCEKQWRCRGVMWGEYYLDEGDLAQVSAEVLAREGG